MHSVLILSSKVNFILYIIYSSADEQSLTVNNKSTYATLGLHLGHSKQSHG